MQEETQLVLCVLDGEEQQKTDICSGNNRKIARIRIKEKMHHHGRGKTFAIFMSTSIFSGFFFFSPEQCAH